MESEFKKKVNGHRLNILLNIMNSIDSVKIHEIATNKKINREGIIRAIDNVSELCDKNNPTDYSTLIELKKLKNIMLEGVNSYQVSFID